MTDYKFYYVGKPTRVNAKLELYGSHATYNNAKIDAVNRAYDYNQSTVIYGVTGSNEVKVINRVTA